MDRAEIQWPQIMPMFLTLGRSEVNATFAVVLQDSPIMDICYVSVKKRGDSQKYRYCKHLCKIDRPSKLVISDYDICSFSILPILSIYLHRKVRGFLVTQVRSST